MPDREKVIKGLELCSNILGCIGNINPECPYALRDCACRYEDLLSDALALLREQEIGHWIFLTDCLNSGVYCSECNTKVFDRYPFKKKFSYFCPHCGTRMEGEVERR